MAWTSVTTLENDLPVGYTDNEYYFTGNRSATRSWWEGGWNDITHVPTFELCDYNATYGDRYFYELPAGDYYLVGDAQSGIFVRKTGAANTKGTVTVKASYNGQADPSSSSPESLGGAWGICSRYSGSTKYYQISIVLGINEETQRGTIFTYRRWKGQTNSGSDWELKYGTYNRYTNSNVAYNLIKNIMKSLYNFHSVPSLTGKGKEIILPQIISTDGKPVSSGSASDFSVFPDGANVRSLANANI